VYYGENSAKIQQHIREAVESVMLAGAPPESVMLAGAPPEKALAKLKRRAQEALEEK
jgi:multiple sugar transport system substrate-binding protein